MANLETAFASARAADRRATTRAGEAGSSLPSGRTSYRTYDDIQAELKQLVTQHPGLVRKVVFGTSYQGREIAGVEIARDVDAADGRPVFFTMGLHHAREWPSAEAAMELAQMLVQEQTTSRIGALLRRERIVILPVVNPDGYISSRGAFDPGDSLLAQEPNVTLVEAIAPPGGLFAYRRKNCDGEILGPQLPCELAWGVDPNRNYGNNWGGSGSSPDVTSQGYHGRSPRSEPETQAVWNYVRKHQVTTLISIHNVAALVLRPPGVSGAGLAPDEPRLKAIGDAIGNAAGYTSQYGFELYDTSGTTDDESYAATGGYGYTVEMGPPDGNFHMPYATGVDRRVDREQPPRRRPRRTARGAADRRRGGGQSPDHAVLRGRAPAGKVLRLLRRFQTRTSPYCLTGVDPILSTLEPICLSGEKPPLLIDDELDATTTVPGSGTYAWHINQSTRPFVGATGRTEAYEVTCEDAGGTVLERHTLVIDRGQDVTLNLGCGKGPSTLADGSRLTGTPKRRRQRVGAVGRRHSRALLARREARQASARRQHTGAQVRRLHAPGDAPARRRAQPLRAARVRAAPRPVGPAASTTREPGALV